MGPYYDHLDGMIWSLNDEACRAAFLRRQQSFGSGETRIRLVLWRAALRILRRAVIASYGLRKWSGYRAAEAAPRPAAPTAVP